ncbi:hypothetical protein ACW4TU_43380 [Streptomyces sp. QTS52]
MTSPATPTDSAGTAAAVARTERDLHACWILRPISTAAPGPLDSFARFVLCGGGVGLLSSGVVARLASPRRDDAWALANALITGASTILCTALHARFTFGAAEANPHSG